MQLTNQKPVHIPKSYHPILTFTSEEKYFISKAISFPSFVDFSPQPSIKTKSRIIKKRLNRILSKSLISIRSKELSIFPIYSRYLFPKLKKLTLKWENNLQKQVRERKSTKSDYKWICSLKSGFRLEYLQVNNLIDKISIRSFRFLGRLQVLKLVLTESQAIEHTNLFRSLGFLEELNLTIIDERQFHFRTNHYIIEKFFFNILKIKRLKTLKLFMNEAWNLTGASVLDHLLTSVPKTQLEELTIHIKGDPNTTLNLSILGKLKKQLQFLEVVISSITKELQLPKVKDREIESFVHVLRRDSPKINFFLMLEDAVVEVCGYGVRYQVPKKRPDKGKSLYFKFQGLGSDDILDYISRINREELSGTIDKLKYRLVDCNKNIVDIVNNLHKLLNLTQLKEYSGIFDHCQKDIEFERIFADISQIKTLKKFKFYV